MVAAREETAATSETPVTLESLATALSNPDFLEKVAGVRKPPPASRTAKHVELTQERERKATHQKITALLGEHVNNDLAKSCR